MQLNSSYIQTPSSANSAVHLSSSRYLRRIEKTLAQIGITHSPLHMSCSSRPSCSRTSQPHLDLFSTLACIDSTLATRTALCICPLPDTCAVSVPPSPKLGLPTRRCTCFVLRVLADSRTSQLHLDLFSILASYQLRPRPKWDCPPTPYFLPPASDLFYCVCLPLRRFLTVAATVLVCI
jgi:hypothetical protein